MYCGPTDEAFGQGVRSRIKSVLEGKSIRAIASDTGLCAETVRRYLTSSKFPAEFIARLSEHYGLNADWLLFGRGVPHAENAGTHALAQSSTPSLLREIADRWEALEHRLDALSARIEALQDSVSKAGGG